MEKQDSYTFKIHLTAKDLWKFSLYHSNKGYLGIFNLIFSIAAVFLLITKWGELDQAYRMLLLVCALMFTVIQPIILYTKAQKQARMPAVKEPIELFFSKEKVEITQAGQTGEMKWDQIWKVERMPGMLIFYMDRIHAYLIPQSALENQEEGFFSMIRENMPAGRHKHI